MTHLFPWALSYSSFPHLRNICLDKPQRTKGYKQAEALWLGTATPRYFVGKIHHWARSIQPEKVICDSSSQIHTCPKCPCFHAVSDTQELILHISCCSGLEHGPLKADKWFPSWAKRDHCLFCGISPVLYRAQHTVDAASSLPGPGIRIQSLLLILSLHRNTTK